MRNVGIICEGPTDFLLLKGLIDKITGEANFYLQLQPEDDLQGQYGNGWKGVWKWCLDHADDLEQFRKAISPQLELLVIQMDGDVSRKEKEVHCQCTSVICKEKEDTNPLECKWVKHNECPVQLPCEDHAPSIEAYIEHLTGRIKEWLGCKGAICVAVPCDSTEAWVVAAYEEMEEPERIESPWETVISRGKSYHGIRIPGHKKSLTVYRQLIPRVFENWELVKKRCISAARFDAEIKKS